MVSRSRTAARRICGAVSIVGFGTALPAFAANLLINPSFEAPSSAPSTSPVATGWTAVNNAQRSTFHMVDLPAGGSWNVWNQTFDDLGGGWSQTVGSISAGATYTLSAQTFFEANYNISESITRMRMTWLNNGSPVGTATTLDIPYTANPTTGVWSLQSVTGVAPATANQIQVFFGWEDGLIGNPAVSSFFDLASLEGPGVPPTNSTWIVDGSGDWNIGGNWANGSAPNAIDAAAEFFGAITSARTVYTDVPVVVGSMSFNNANQYVITGAGQLTLDVTSGSAALNVTSGSHKINLPFFINDNTTANISAGATLTLADPTTVASGKTLTKSGAGTLRIISTFTGTGPNTLFVTGGTAALDYSVGTAAVSGTPATGNVSVISAAKVTIGANQTLRSVDVSTGSAGDQEFDLAGNTVRTYPGSLVTEEQNVYNDIKNARNSPSGKDGIYDSTRPSASYSVGVTDQNLDANGNANVYIRLTRNGDANLDGVVNANDFTRLASNFGFTGRLWDQGDFNYDGTVNANDFTLLASNFGLSATGLNGEVTPQDWANLSAAVPEPISAPLFALAGLLAASRRRRNAN